jgi:hypothetical protein
MPCERQPTASGATPCPRRRAAGPTGVARILHLRRVGRTVNEAWCAGHEVGGHLGRHRIAHQFYAVRVEIHRQKKNVRACENPEKLFLVELRRHEGGIRMMREQMTETCEVALLADDPQRRRKALVVQFDDGPVAIDQGLKLSVGEDRADIEEFRRPGRSDVSLCTFRPALDIERKLKGRKDAAIATRIGMLHGRRDGQTGFGDVEEMAQPPVHSEALERSEQTLAMRAHRPVVHDVDDQRQVERGADLFDQRHHAVAAEDRVDHLGAKVGDPPMQFGGETRALGDAVLQDALPHTLEQRCLRRRGGVGDSGCAFGRRSPPPAQPAERFDEVEFFGAKPVVVGADVVARRIAVVVNGGQAVLRPAGEQRTERRPAASIGIECDGRQKENAREGLHGGYRYRQFEEMANACRAAGAGLTIFPEPRAIRGAP